MNAWIAVGGSVKQNKTDKTVHNISKFMSVDHKTNVGLSGIDEMMIEEMIEG